MNAQEPLAAHTWLRVGGPAEYFAEPHTTEQLATVLSRCRAADMNVRLLGGGSNVLVADGPIQGMVIRLADPAIAYYLGQHPEVCDDLMKNAQKINMDDLIDKLLDEHLDGEGDSGSGDDDEDGEGKEGKGRPRLSKEDRQAIKDEIREALLQAAQATGAGNLPSGVKRLIKDLTAPVVNWRELLEQQIQSTVKNDFTWLRPSRRSWHMDAVMPGMKPGTQIDVCVAIDTSGSISEQDLKDFLSEVKGIMEEYKDFKLDLWCFDTEIYAYKQFTGDTADEINEYEPQGGGGTDFDINFQFMKDNDITPKKFIMFTDGYPFGSWGDPDYCDTVFIIHGSETIKPPFGVFSHYEFKE